MRAPLLAMLVLALSLAFIGFSGIPVSAATDDHNLTGVVYLADGTPLSATTWGDGTGFAVFINHTGSWTTAWRYPASGWYLTSGGAYSIVLPASEKDVNWANTDPYRVEFAVSSITGNPGQTNNATSHGTGDLGEFSPAGATQNAIVWSAIDNWQRWDVVLLAEPDLAILAGDIAATPNTVQTGQEVQVSATVTNLGARSADFLLALFVDADADGRPGGGETYGQYFPSLDSGANLTVQRAWNTPAEGTYTHCAYADPADAVVESDEGNNAECVDVFVTPAPETRPDYAPVSPIPHATVRTGLSLPVSLSLQIRNHGNATPAESATLAFFNETTPTTPLSTFSVTPLPPSATSSRFNTTWISPGAPTAVRVIADVDYGGDLVEWDETDNRFAWTIDVVAGPVTNLVVGSPNHTATEVFITSLTSLSLTVLDQSGSGIRNTSYRVDGGPWVNYTATGPFALPGEGSHLLEWFSQDFAGNVEAVAGTVLVLDDTPPVTTLTVGEPRHVAAKTFVSSATPIGLTGVDGGPLPVGTSYIQYRVDGGSWTPYIAQFSVAPEGSHTIRYLASDWLGNTEAEGAREVVVDDTAPAITTDVGDPKYAAAQLFVRSLTTTSISAAEGGVDPVGVASLEHRTDGGPWTTYVAPFALAGPDRITTVEVRSVDLLGHASFDEIALVLDDTPPLTTPSHADGRHPPDTAFTLQASDAGSGVLATRYSLDDGPLLSYAAPFTLPVGSHEVRYLSTDRLENTEATRTLTVTITGEQAPVPGANWKPQLAAAYCFLLILAGVWSSRRKPLRRGSRPEVRAFVTFAIPFVAVETATGVVSYLTGWLSVPPLFGPGLAVDTAILAAGVGVAAYRGLVGTSSE